MTLCSIRCPICGNWLSRTTTKRGKPFLYCGHCGYGTMLLRGSAIKDLDVVCQTISESDLPPETLKKHRSKL